VVATSRRLYIRLIELRHSGNQFNMIKNENGR
jgi:hypothetical protein